MIYLYINNKKIYALFTDYVKMFIKNKNSMGDIEMKNENKEESIFYDLTPINDIELGIYEEAINFSLKKVRKINTIWFFILTL